MIILEVSTSAPDQLWGLWNCRFSVSSMPGVPTSNLVRQPDLNVHCELISSILMKEWKYVWGYFGDPFPHLNFQRSSEEYCHLSVLCSIRLGIRSGGCSLEMESQVVQQQWKSHHVYSTSRRSQSEADQSSGGEDLTHDPQISRKNIEAMLPNPQRWRLPPLVVGCLGHWEAGHLSAASSLLGLLAACANQGALGIYPVCPNALACICWYSCCCCIRGW